LNPRFIKDIGASKKLHGHLFKSHFSFHFDLASWKPDPGFDPGLLSSPFLYQLSILEAWHHFWHHFQSLCGLAHYDFNMPGVYGYEQAFAVMRKLRISEACAIQQYRRMIFNVIARIARNQDDHTKNIAFLMDNNGKWRLSPAFDVTYSHNPAGKWTNQHQMSINGKRDHFLLADLIDVGESISLPRPGESIKEVADAVQRWPLFAGKAGLNEERISEISRYHRLDL